MAGVNTSLLAIAGLLALCGVGYIAINMMRAGFDYVSARGNPRNRAQAHESLWDMGKGAILIFGAPAIAALVASVIHFG